MRCVSAVLGTVMALSIALAVNGAASAAVPAPEATTASVPVTASASLMDTSAVVPSDVPASYPFLSDIQWLVASGITGGYLDGTFRPAAPVTRQAMAAFLYRFAGQPAFVPPGQSPFVDVSPRDTFYREISWLRSAGVSTGSVTAKGVEFRPSEPVSRQAMAAFLHRIAGAPDGPPTTTPFRDVGAGNGFQAQIEWLAAVGVSTGTRTASGTYFLPSEPVSRGAMAAFLHRMRVNVCDLPSTGCLGIGETLSPTDGTTSPEPTAPAPGPASTSSFFPDQSAASEAITPDDGILFGAAVSQGGALDMERAVSTFERTIGRKLDAHRIYNVWDGAAPGRTVQSTVERGRTPVLSIIPKLVNGTRLSWASVARGDHDARIAEHAAAIAALQVPVFLTFQHEPELATAHGTPAEYRAAWRHYVDVFRSRGVKNAVWTWIVTPKVFSTTSTIKAADLYPGDDVVDWIGLDVYNWNGCSPKQLTSWRTMEQLAMSFRTFGQTRAKPLMLAEWGSFEDTSDPTRKAAWFRQSMATFDRWPEVRAVLYFNVHGSCPWFVDSTPASLAAFTEIANAPAAHTRASAWLNASTTHGTAPLTVTFDAARSTGTAASTGSQVAAWTLDLGDGSTPTTGTGRPPASVTHTYGAGIHRATLTVRDTAGDTDTDTVTVTAAPAPAVKVEVKDVTSSSATLTAYANLHGYAGTVTFQWGTTTGYGSTSPVLQVPLVTYVKTMRHPVSGLAPGTTYQYRATTKSPAGTTVTTGSFSTAGPPTSSRAWTSGSTSTSTTFNAQVHPHRVPTTTWLEWGPTSALGTRSAITELPGVGYERTVSSGVVSGLTAGATYHYRVVAKNALGTLSGPIQTKTMPG